MRKSAFPLLAGKNEYGQGSGSFLNNSGENNLMMKTQ